MRGTITGVDHDGLHVTAPAKTWCSIAATSSTAGSTTPTRSRSTKPKASPAITCSSSAPPASTAKRLRRTLPGAAQRLALRHHRPSRRARTPRHGIPLPTEAEPDPEAELLTRLHISAAKNLVTIDDPDAARVDELAATIPAAELLRRARDARDAEQRWMWSTLTSCAPRTTAPSPPATISKSGAGYVHSIATTSATSWPSTTTPQRVSSTSKTTTATGRQDDRLGRTRRHRPTRTRPTLTGRHRDTHPTRRCRRRRRTELGDRAVRLRCRTRRRRPATGVPSTSPSTAPPTNCAPPRPAWLTTWLGPRPADTPGAAVWDDATTRIAHHRLLHDIADDDRRARTATQRRHIGAAMATPDAAHSSRTAVWLTDRHHQPDVTPLIVRSPDRARRLRNTNCNNSSPPRPPISASSSTGIVRANSTPPRCTTTSLAAMAGQDATGGTGSSPTGPTSSNSNRVTHAHRHPTATRPLADRATRTSTRRPRPTPAARPDPRRPRGTHPRRDSTNKTSTTTPSASSTARRDHLRDLAARAVSPAERDAIDNELTALDEQLRAARREQTVERAFDRYLPDPTDDARATRITTLAHDTLTTQPAWVIDHVRHLHDNDQLNGRDVAELATRIIHAAAHHDRHGQLPAGLARHRVADRRGTRPAIEIG